MLRIENARVVLEDGILNDGAVLLENDRIVDVGPTEEVSCPENVQIIDAKGAYVGPGFVDIHVHGGGDAMFHADPVKAAKHFLAHGETTVLVTLYYDLSPSDFADAIDRIKAAMEEMPSIAGFYMEGPYMNPKYGASPEKNKWKGPIRREDYSPLLQKAGDKAKVWAIAPEREGVADFMADARKANPGTVFAVGHSEATPEQVWNLKKYGIRLQTHCMNATGQPGGRGGIRGCGPDEACLLDDEMYAELISDSLAIHVKPDMQKLVLKVKGIDKVILISDSFVSYEEAPPDLRHVTDLSFAANGGLSGSRLTVDAACRNVMTHTGCSIVDAFLMASRNPARAIGMDKEIGTIEIGKKANLVIVDDQFHVQGVILNGKEVIKC